MTNFTRERWNALCDRMGVSTSNILFELIWGAYSDPARRYHNVQHIEDCLGWLDTLKDHCEYPDEVEFALWLHDVIYVTRRKDNELRSAVYAADILRQANCNPATTIRIKANILSTAHSTRPCRPDAQLTADIDLIILGQNAYSYCEFEIAIREEYLWVDFPTYARRRVQVLQSFLDRDRIYSTDAIHKHYEAAARTNLSKVIYRLTGV